MAVGGAIQWASQALIAGASFNGVIKELKIFNYYTSWQYMYANRFRINTNHTYDNPYLVAYWRLNTSYGPNDLTAPLYDSSKYAYTATVDQNGGIPRMIQVSDNRAALQLCVLKDLATCKSVGNFY
jgi:hypothetical protein